MIKYLVSFLLLTCSAQAVEKLTVPAQSVILLDGEITSATAVVGQLKMKALQMSEVFIYINSPGGSIPQGGQIISEMENSPLKINTICAGECASMAFLVFQYGKTRYITPNSVLLTHQGSLEIADKLDTVKNTSQFFAAYYDKLGAKIAHKLGLSFSSYKQLISTDLWIGDQEAVSKKFADKLVYVTLVP